MMTKHFWMAAATLLLASATNLSVNAAEPNAAVAPSSAVATFASGCFWCTEADFDKVPGVLTTVSGYMGGATAKPNYEQVGTGKTGHAEVLQVTYDPAKVTYQKLLDTYWRNVDMFDGSGQFCDRGSQYRPAIFTHGDEQAKLAQDSKNGIADLFQKPVAVEITSASAFTAAEDYHQNYYKTNPLRYKIYRHGCGRDARLESIWANAPSQ